MTKESVFTVKLETELRDAFMAEAEATHRPASQVVRELMRNFVQQRREARKHDAWFRSKVQEALDETGPSVSHDAFMDETQAIIDRIAAEKSKA